MLDIFQANETVDAREPENNLETKILGDTTLFGLEPDTQTEDTGILISRNSVNVDKSNMSVSERMEVDDLGEYMNRSQASLAQLSRNVMADHDLQDILKDIGLTGEIHL